MNVREIKLVRSLAMDLFQLKPSMLTYDLRIPFYGVTTTMFRRTGYWLGSLVLIKIVKNSHSHLPPSCFPLRTSPPIDKLLICLAQTFCDGVPKR